MFNKYKTLKTNYEICSKRNVELYNESVKYQKQNEVLLETNCKIVNELDLMTEKIKELKKENKNLKTLLTKNKINYRKEN